MLAERLDWPYVSPASAVSLDGSGEPGAPARVTRAAPAGEEIVEVALPAVVAVGNEVGQPRYPSSRGMMAARRTPPEVFDAMALAAAGDGAGVELVELFVPELQGQCVILEGESAAAKARTLLDRLIESGALDG